MFPFIPAKDRIRLTNWIGYPKRIKKNGCYELYLNFLKKFIVSDYHPYTGSHFRSMHILRKERRRHYDSFKFIIHPLSAFRMFWQFIMCCVWIITIPTEIYLGSFLIRLEEDKLEVNTILDTVFGLNCICKIDILLNFITGYWDKKLETFVLHPFHITLHYLRTFFFIDILCFIQETSTLLTPIGLATFRIIYSLHYLRLCRMISVAKYMKMILTLFGCDTISIGFIRSILFACIYIHVTACLKCLIADWFFFENNTSWVKQMDKVYMVENERMYAHQLYLHSLLAVLWRYNTFVLEKQMAPLEMLLHTLVTIGTMCCYTYFIIKSISYVNSLHYNAARYSKFMNELNHFLKMQNIHEEIQKDICEAIKFNFKKEYFDEECLMETLMTRQQNEIQSVFYKKFLRKAPLLRQLSEIQVMVLTDRLKWFCLVMGHSIEVKQCTRIMYFVVSGTLAVFEGTKEIKHIHDGDNFGENVTMSKSRKIKRDITVVALENCHMTSITAADYEAITKVALVDTANYLRRRSTW